ncbi:MAG: DNA polymerase III subunit delta [Coriobacteriales bacterium]|nr:DNA polymerase III subunit delta [Coriobacteriales bacterium]
MASGLGDLKPVYLITGSEQLLLDQAVSRLHQRFVDAGGTDFDITHFDGENASVDEVVGVSNTLPFGAERRLVVVKNADKLNKESHETLAAYAGDPSPYAVLVLLAPKLAKNTRLYKAVDKLGGAAEYKAPAKKDYPRWVADAFAARGRRLAPDAAELMVRLVGYDLRRLEIEIEKVIAFAASKESLGRDDVEGVVIASAGASVFEFLDALADRNAARAMRLLARLLADGESVYGLHAMSVRRIRDLITARSLGERGERGVGPLARTLGRPDWQIKQLPRQADGFADGELDGLLRRAAATEAGMKTSREARLAFERGVLAVCGA